MTYKVVKRGKSIRGHIQLNGSKSISNRILIIEALAGGVISKRNLSDSGDTLILQDLLYSPGPEFDAHDAGTTFRFLTAYLALQEGEWVLTGSDRMKERPIGDLVKPLRELGADIKFIGKENYPPIKIMGGRLKGNKVNVNSGISSQFASALLMIAPALKNGLTLELSGDIVSAPYIEMTLSLMQYFGVYHGRHGSAIHIPNQSYQVRDIFIESDWSAASYYYEIAAFADEVELTLSGLLQHSFQGDSAIASFMKKFGIATSYENERILLHKSSPSGNLQFNLKAQPDLSPALITTSAGLSQAAFFTGLGHLKYKESHRAEALKAELKKCGIVVINENNAIHVSGKFVPGNYTFSTYLDHRMAMTFAPLAMLCGEIFIEDPLVVKKSYPAFWNDMEALGFEVSEV